MFEFLKNKESDVYKKVYRQANPDFVKDLYYGNEKDAKIILSKIAECIYEKSGKYSKEEISKCAEIYVQVWLRKHGGLKAEYMSSQYIHEQLEKRFSEIPPLNLHNAIDAGIEYIYLKEPTIKTRDAQLQKNFQSVIFSSKTAEEMDPQYFEEFKKGFLYFEQSRFNEAIACFNNCINMNRSISKGHFELCESYINLKNFDMAEKTLLNMFDILKTDEEKARFYRRYGFIQIEKKVSLYCAMACYVYSMKYEAHPSVQQELMYICEIMNWNINEVLPAVLNDPVEILRKYNIPIFGNS